MIRAGVVVTGSAGMLGQAVTQALSAAGYQVSALDHHALDVTNESEVRRVLRELQPGSVIQCAAFTRVDDAEAAADQAMAVNSAGAAHVAAACREIGARFVYPGTDYVFDGRSNQPYTPDATPAPINAYGRSKLAGEAAARTAENYLIVRTCWLYGPGGRNFVRTIADKLRAGARTRVVTDQVGALTWTHDLALALVTLMERAPAGIYHACNSGAASWYDVAFELAGILGFADAVEPCLTKDFPTAAVRPAYSVLDTTATDALIEPLPAWQASLRAAVSAGAY